MTDQDHDGSHIKGLFFNMMHHFWPEEELGQVIFYAAGILCMVDSVRGGREVCVCVCVCVCARAHDRKGETCHAP